MRVRLRLLLALLLGLTCVAGAHGSRAAPVTPPAPRLSLKLLVVDPHRKGGVSARWQANGGIPSDGHPSPGLFFQKRVPTVTDSAAVAVVEGIAGWPLTELGFDYARDAGTCDDRAPRFVVGTADGSLFEFGCGGGVHEGVAPGWSRVRFEDGDAVLNAGLHPWPGFGNVAVQSLAIVFDEGPDQGLGRAYLDNIDVDGVWITGPGTTP